MGRKEWVPMVNKDDTPRMVTIEQRRYEQLIEKEEWLGCLEAAGVDNWQGIDEACRISREDSDT